jgi:endoglucanase
MMKSLSFFPLLILFIFSISEIACSNSTDSVEPALTLSKEKLTFDEEIGMQKLAIKTNVEWSVSSSDSWCVISPTSGGSGDKQIEVSVLENVTTDQRKTTITIIAGTLSKQIKVTQTENINSIPADKTGMNSDALALATKIKLGWNLGNSLEACASSTSASETYWGNPKTTKAMIDAVKAAGFNAVRIPAAWSGYIENQATYKLQDTWLARVKEVVDYCVDNDMYAILNIHWDGGWLQEHTKYADQVEVNKKQKALWVQIAAYFRNYDEHLLFAGTNEVNTGDSSTPTEENFKVQMSYNQTFVDAVRATGGRNTYRNLVIQAFNTDIDLADQNLTVSTDNVEKRMMVEVHYYTPWQFCGMETDANWGKYAALWGTDYKQYAVGELEDRWATWGDEEYVKTAFAKVKAKFVDKGYPVILGEYGAISRLSLTGDALKHHLDSRAYYLKYITQQAKVYGMVPFYWDNGYSGNHGFALFDRGNYATVDSQALNALVEGSAANYPY